MVRARITRAARIGAAALLLAVATVPGIVGPASGEESIGELEARMDDIQADLDATTAKVEALRGEVDEIHHRMDEIESRMSELTKKNVRLQEEVIARADALYRSGSAGMFETFFGSETFAELSDRAEMLSQVSLDDNGVFVDLARSQAELRRLEEELGDRRSQLSHSTEALREEIDALQDKFLDVSSEYDSLRARLAPDDPPAPSTVSGTLRVRASSGMACPVAGPHSFIDSWGAPRSGHTHQGVDMMAAYGTPLVAIVSGTITYAAYDGSGGNMIFLSGDDGNSYWYMHNQQNLVSGGHVSVGQQIATVGDTGNAAGTPHLHFEYHPGGGGPVNPYPLVASIC